MIVNCCARTEGSETVVLGSPWELRYLGGVFRRFNRSKERQKRGRRYYGSNRVRWSDEAVGHGTGRATVVNREATALGGVQSLCPFVLFLLLRRASSLY